MSRSLLAAEGNLLCDLRKTQEWISVSDLSSHHGIYTSSGASLQSGADIDKSIPKMPGKATAYCLWQLISFRGITVIQKNKYLYPFPCDSKCHLFFNLLLAYLWKNQYWNTHSRLIPFNYVFHTKECGKKYKPNVKKTWKFWISKIHLQKEPAVRSTPINMYVSEWTHCWVGWGRWFSVQLGFWTG